MEKIELLKEFKDNLIKKIEELKATDFEEKVAEKVNVYSEQVRQELKDEIDKQINEAEININYVDELIAKATEDIVEEQEAVEPVLQSEV